MTIRKVKKGEDLLVLLLARGMSHVKAAKAAGVSPQKISHYLHDPAFRQRIEEERNRFRDTVVGQLTAMSTKAMKALEELMQSPDGRVRIQAVKVWKECALDLGNQYDLARQIQELREANTFHVEEDLGESQDK